MRIFLRSLRRWIESSSTRVVGNRVSITSLLSASEFLVASLGGVAGGDVLPVTSCSMRLSRTETMIAASSVSRKTIMKIGTEKTSFAILDGTGYKKRGHVFGLKARGFR